jgi:hypothetical protein
VATNARPAARPILGHEHRVEERESVAAVRLGHQGSERAELGELRVKRRVVRIGRVRDLPRARGRVGLVEKPPDGVLQKPLFVRKTEIHGQAAFGSRGRPRPRSPMMFFWICAVPPPMIRPSENIHW